jgi:hypothetical protein
MKLHGVHWDGRRWRVILRIDGTLPMSQWKGSYEAMPGVRPCLRGQSGAFTPRPSVDLVGRTTPIFFVIRPYPPNLWHVFYRDGWEDRGVIRFWKPRSANEISRMGQRPRQPGAWRWRRAKTG